MKMSLAETRQVVLDWETAHSKTYSLAVADGSERPPDTSGVGALVLASNC
jgi:hypothetical protein